MDQKELLAALRMLKVETGSLVCLGCGHEHHCSTKGCAIIRETMEHLQKQVCPERLYDVVFDECSPEGAYITSYSTEGLYIAWAGDYIPVEDIGQSAFATPEEAEKRLHAKLENLGAKERSMVHDL